MYRKSVLALLFVVCLFLNTAISVAIEPTVTASMSNEQISPNGDGVLDYVEITYSVAADAQVTVNILDSNGLIVRTLYQEGEQPTASEKSAEATYTLIWNGKDQAGNTVSDGLYTYWIHAERVEDDVPPYELTVHGDGETVVGTPRYLRVDEKGNLYFVDTSSKKMSKFASDGTGIWSFSPPISDAVNAPLGTIRFAKDFTFDDKGRIYWNDTLDDNWSRVQVWEIVDETLKFTGLNFGSGGNVESSGTDIVMDALSFIEFHNGYIYVGDAQNDRVQKIAFDGESTYTHVWSSYGTTGVGSDYLRRGFRDTHSVRVAPCPSIDPGQPDKLYLYVADPGEQEHIDPVMAPRESSFAVLDLETGDVLKRYPDPDNTILGTQGLFSDQVSKGLSVDSDDRSIFICEYKKGTGESHKYEVLKLNTWGQLLLTIKGANSKNFNRPYYSTVDVLRDPASGAKRLYIADQNNGRVVRVVLLQAEKTGEITVTGAVSVESKESPAEFAISQSYPNPFNPVTSISYTLPYEQRITLKIYNVLGEEVAELADRIEPAGNHTVEWDASEFSSGMYFYRIIAGPFEETRKLMLVR